MYPFRTISLFFVLSCFWLLLSGIFKPFLLISGFILTLFVVLFARRIELIDHEGHPIHNAFKAVFVYWPWLLKEIVKSALLVSKIIINPKLPISPSILHVKASQKTDLGRTIFANSITLTPGTISVEVETDKIEVHALTENGGRELEEGSMNQRVVDFE